LKITVPIALRWSDFDAYGHVNNAEMLRILEEARMEVFWRPDAGVEALPTALLEAGPGVAIQSLISSQSIEYLVPIPYTRRPIDVELWIGRLGGAHLEVSYEVYSPRGVSPRLLHTRASTTLVLVHSATGRPTRIPPAVRESWQSIVEEPVRFTRR
jgi:acyl-CoA thioester hydrolase